MTRALPRDARAVMSGRHEPADSADFAPTPPWGGRALVEVLARIDPAVAAGRATAWEPACGAGHLAHALRERFAAVRTSDAYRYGDHEVLDFLAEREPGHEPGRRTPCADWIITNPPYRDRVEPFIRRAWERAGRGVAMLLQLRALEGLGRHALFEDVPLYAVCPFAERLAIHMGGWSPSGNTATAYAWFVFVRPETEGEIAPRVAGGRRIPIPPGSQMRHSRLSDARFALRGADGRVSARDLMVLAARLASETGIVLDGERMVSLAALADQGEGGTCGLPQGPLQGWRLASLVQAGLAERIAPDSLGGCRYRASAEGLELLRDSGWASRTARPAVRGRAA